jgi:hypothetical protein
MLIDRAFQGKVSVPPPMPTCSSQFLLTARLALRPVVL